MSLPSSTDTDLELIVQPVLASNAQRSTRLCFLKIGTKGMCHRSQVHFIFLIRDIYGMQFEHSLHKYSVK